MSTTPSKNDRAPRIPDPVYAVAGAGDYAYRQLRKLPAVAAELREELPNRMAELRTELPARVERARSQTNRRVPEAVNTLLAEGLRMYLRLVARGERVVNRGRRQAATTVAPSGEVVTRPTRRARPAAPKATTGAAKATPRAAKATPMAAKKTTRARATTGTRTRRAA